MSCLHFSPPPLLQTHFGFLTTEWHFALVAWSDQPAAFDNFVAQYERAAQAVEVVRDRGQVFIALRCGAGPWHALYGLLLQHGWALPWRPRARDASWSGWGMAQQALALRRHGPALLQMLAAQEAA